MQHSQKQGIEQNLTHGNVTRLLIRFTLPFLLSGLVQSLYNVADMYIVGLYQGSAGISAVNNGGNVTFLLTNFILGLCNGGTILIGQFLGGERREALRETVSTLITFLLIAGAAVTVIMLSLGRAILGWINTPPEAFDQALDYLQVTSWGVIFIFLYNALSGIMRGMGDSKRPMYFILLACIVNIGLDFLMVGVMDMGARGAALATIIAQAISVICCIAYMRSHDFVFDFHPRSFKLYKRRLSQIVKLGLPTGLQNVITSLSFMIITAMINPLGVAASAGVAVVGKLNSFAFMPISGVSASVSAMSAQNIGAQRFDRARNTLRAGLKLSVPMAVVIFALMQGIPGFLIGIFSDEQPVIDAGITYIRTFAFDYLIIAVLFTLNGLFMGAGHTTFALINGVLSSVLLRVPVSYFFGIHLGWGLSGMGLGAPVASLGSTILALCYYGAGKWKKPVISRAKSVLELE